MHQTPEPERPPPRTARPLSNFGSNASNMMPVRPARREPPVPGGDKRRPPPQPQPPQSNSLALPPRPKRGETVPQSDDDFDDFDDDEYEEPMEQQPPRPPAKKLTSYNTPDDVYEEPDDTSGVTPPVGDSEEHTPGEVYDDCDLPDEFPEPVQQDVYDDCDLPDDQPPVPARSSDLYYDCDQPEYPEPEAARQHIPLPAIPTQRNLQPEPEEYSAIGDEENVYNEAEEDERPQPIGRSAFPPPGVQKYNPPDMGDDTYWTTENVPDRATSAAPVLPPPRKRGTPLPQPPQPVNDFQEDTYYEPEEEAKPPPRIHQSQPRTLPVPGPGKAVQASGIPIDTMAIRNAQNKLRTAIPAFPEPKKKETTTTSETPSGPISVSDRIKMFNTGKAPAVKTPAPAQPNKTATLQPAGSAHTPAPPRATSPSLKPLPPPVNSIPSNTSKGPVSPSPLKSPVVSAPHVGNLMNQEDGLYQYRWYFSNIDRNVTEDKLRQLGTDGAFMVRKSQAGDSLNPYSLSLWYKQRMWNFRIGIRKNKRFAIGTEQPGEKLFDQVPDLVEYHRKHTLTVTDKNGNEYPVKLGQFPMM